MFTISFLSSSANPLNTFVSKGNMNNLSTCTSKAFVANCRGRGTNEKGKGLVRNLCIGICYTFALQLVF